MDNSGNDAFYDSYTEMARANERFVGMARETVYGTCNHSAKELHEAAGEATRAHAAFMEVAEKRSGFGRSLAVR